MANIKSSEKDILRSEKRRLRNQAVKSEMRTRIRRVRAAAKSGDLEAAAQLYRAAQRSIDRAVGKGVLKANTGSRYKARLHALL